MKNLRRLYSECVSEAKGIGLDISDNITRITVNNRLSRALGRCTMSWDAWNRKYSYKIEMNPCMLADDLEDKVPKNTIMHELIHTCKDCMNHGSEFQHRASIVNRKLGYNVHTQTDSRILEAAGVVVKKTPDRYGIVCNKCGRVVQKKKRWSPMLENIGNYHHGGSCGGSLHVISLVDGVEVWTVGIAADKER